MDRIAQRFNDDAIKIERCHKMIRYYEGKLNGWSWLGDFLQAGLIFSLIMAIISGDSYALNATSSVITGICVILMFVDLFVLIRYHKRIKKQYKMISAIMQATMDDYG